MFLASEVFTPLGQIAPTLRAEYKVMFDLMLLSSLFTLLGLSNMNPTRSYTNCHVPRTVLRYSHSTPTSGSYLQHEQALP